MSEEILQDILTEQRKQTELLKQVRDALISPDKRVNECLCSEDPHFKIETDGTGKVTSL